jgi:hypothetical protein
MFGKHIKKPLWLLAATGHCWLLLAIAGILAYHLQRKAVWLLGSISMDWRLI